MMDLTDSRILGGQQAIALPKVSNITQQKHITAANVTTIERETIEGHGYTSRLLYLFKDWCSEYICTLEGLYPQAKLL
jgi:hypothetical protein